MNYLDRLFTILFILYKDNNYNEKLLICYIALLLHNETLTRYKKNNIKIMKDSNKNFYMKKVKNNDYIEVNDSFENAMGLYKERYHKSNKPIIISSLKQSTQGYYKIVKNKDISNNKKLIKAPTLILTVNIMETLRGKIYFSKPIKFIDNINNKMIVKEKLVVISSNNKLNIFIEGYLQTCIDCVEMDNKFYSYVLNTPLSSVKYINEVQHGINLKTDYDKLDIEIVKLEQRVNKKLNKNNKEYFNELNLLININLIVNILKNDFITI